MKIISKVLFICLTLFILVSACKKAAIRYITSGTWTISLYSENGSNETSDFAGYVFDFNSDNTLVVTLPAGGTVTGSWSYNDAASKYLISLSGTGKLDKLNENWLILSKSSTLIELKNDNPAKNELLTFKKK